MNRDTATINQVLRDLSPRQRQEIVSEALLAALQDMPDEERRKIQKMAEELSDRIRNVGNRIALEVLGVIGTLWARQS
jgi:hypothetical protein